MSRKPCLRGHLDTQEDNGAKHCRNLNDNTFTIFTDHCEDRCIGKSLFLVIHKVLRLFLNKLTVDEKHYLITGDNLTQTIEIQLSQKQKTFCEFFILRF